MHEAGWPTHDRPLLIGIAGGSGSGKTTIAMAVMEEIGESGAAHIAHDAYYRHQPDLPFEQRAKVNYDHPHSLETELLIKHLEELRSGHEVDVPEYDFNQHLRRPEWRRVEPRPVIIVEGILILAEPELREMFDLKIYVDADPDLRILRRLERDIAERGRSRESVVDQYHATVRPMHLQFVEPSKRYADLIIPHGYNTSAVGTVVRMIRHHLAQPAEPV